MLKIDAKRSCVLLSAVLALALGLRLFHLGQRVVWFDEAYSLLLAKAPASRIIGAAVDDAHSPFYYLVLRYWQFVVGGETGARLLSVLAGVATVGVVYWLGRELAGRGAGLLGAVFLSVCPLHVWYSQEIRMYALQTLLVALSFLFMVLALQRGRVVFWGLYALATALSVYAQYISLFAVVGQNLYVAVHYRSDRGKLRCWWLSQCAAVLVFGPGIRLFVYQLARPTTIGGPWVHPLEWRRIIGFLSLFSGANLGDPGPRTLSILITATALVVAVVILLRRDASRSAATLLLLWFGLPIVLLALQSMAQNRFLPRVLVLTTPALALLLGCAVAEAGRAVARTIVVGTSIALLAANLYALGNYYFSENDWVKSRLREAATKLAQEVQATDVVVHTTIFSYRPFQYYLGDGVAQGAIPEPENLPHFYGAVGDGRVPRSAGGCKRMWLVLYPDRFHPGVPEKTRGWMDAHHRLVKVLYDSRMVSVVLYERRDAVLTPAGE
jgi:uncharacterized membrane protein